MFVIVFWAALLLVAYTYLIYPLLLWLLTAGRRRPDYALLDDWPFASLIIAAYNEEKKVASVLPKIIVTAFQALQLIYFFTAGADEVKCWTIRKGYKAPQAAGTIHTDFERGFICAETMSYDDLAEYGNEQDVKGAGKYRQQGKEYVVKDGDIIYFKFNVTNSGKK